MKKLYYLVIILFIISLISTSIILLNEKNSYKESKHIVLENYNILYFNMFVWIINGLFFFNYMGRI